MLGFTREKYVYVYAYIKINGMISIYGYLYYIHTYYEYVDITFIYYIHKYKFLLGGKSEIFNNKNSL